MNISKIQIVFQPQITDDQLWEFYVRNDICEVGYGRETAVIPLHNPCVIAAAFCDDKLVGLVRALFDGLAATIMEFDLECELQGDNLKYNNGSIIEKDEHGIAKRLGETLINGLRSMGNTFLTAYIVGDCEEKLYSTILMEENVGHKVYYIDERCYTKGV